MLVRLVSLACLACSAPIHVAEDAKARKSNFSGAQVRYSGRSWIPLATVLACSGHFPGPELRWPAVVTFLSQSCTGLQWSHSCAPVTLFLLRLRFPALALGTEVTQSQASFSLSQAPGKLSVTVLWGFPGLFLSQYGTLVSHQWPVPP